MIFLPGTGTFEGIFLHFFSASFPIWWSPQVHFWHFFSFHINIRCLSIIVNLPLFRLFKEDKNEYPDKAEEEEEEFAHKSDEDNIDFNY